MKDLDSIKEQKRLEEAKEALDQLTTRRTTTVDGVSNLITMRELGGILYLKPKTVQRFVNRNIKPIGGVVKIGKRNLIHVWAIQRLLNQAGRCPECGRHWDDKLAKAEIEGKLGESTAPFMSTGGLQGGLKLREELRAIGAEDITLEDIKARPSIFGEHGTDRYYPEESTPPPDWEEQYLSMLRELGFIEDEDEEKPRKKPPVRSVVNKLPRRHK